MKLQTTNLINETLEFLNSKPWHYGDEDIFQLTESVEHGTLKKSGNSYSFALRGKQVELKPQPAKRMWDRYSKKAEAGVSEEQAKKIAKRRRAITEMRQLYKLTKERERMIVACGDLVIGNQELYVMILNMPDNGNVLAVLHADFSGERAKSQIFKARLEELHNYATKQPVILDKRLDKRGSGSKYNVGRKAKEADE
ncbi:hypothetical protein [Aeromonas sp. 604534]|uniref:hypothetical protein n=1 Tax=Aeromonas sp. 604534 TaxID=2712055 RepID=UPI003BA1F8F0